MSFEICFNLDQIKILSSGHGLNEPYLKKWGLRHPHIAFYQASNCKMIHINRPKLFCFTNPLNQAVQWLSGKQKYQLLNGKKFPLVSSYTV